MDGRADPGTAELHDLHALNHTRRLVVVGLAVVIEIDILVPILILLEEPLQKLPAIHSSWKI